MKDARRDAGPRVMIIGGGFGGLAAARALAKARVQVTLVDRRNHHVFQPLLYQVATAALSPADIAASIRHVLRKQANCRVALAEITGIDLAKRLVKFDGGPAHGESAVEYDWLIVAAGATHSYFGHPEWEQFAPGLKTLEDAILIRRKILLAFESAEYEGDEERRRAALTFAIVGGGATGVELAGAIMEIAAKTIPADFRNIDTKTTRVILFEGSDRLLEAFPPELSERARRDLEAMGVQVRLGARVTEVTADGVRVGGEFIAVRNVLWAAGVVGAPLARSMGAELDRAGRVIVGPDLTVPGHPNVFVVGDLAAAKSGGNGAAVPGVAQGAMQAGAYAGRIIARECAGSGGSAATERKPFVYRDKGSMATIGRAKAIAWINGMKFGGFIAWAMWGGIHVMFLINFRSRLAVIMSWLWNWLLFSRDARLIMGKAELDIAMPRDGELVQREG